MARILWDLEGATYGDSTVLRLVPGFTIQLFGKRRLRFSLCRLLMQVVNRETKNVFRTRPLDVLFILYPTATYWNIIHLLVVHLLYTI